MKAIILAAGRGSRMEALTNNKPKCMVELDGETLLSRQIRSLRNGGITEIAIVTGYLSEMISGKADHQFHNPRWSETNMVTSLTTASAWLRSGPCIVSYSDIFFSKYAVRKLIESRYPLTITYDPNWETLWRRRFGDPLMDAETFKISANGQILEIGKPPSNCDEIKGQFMGLLKFTPDSWNELEVMRIQIPLAERDNLDMTGALQRIIERGNIMVKGIPVLGRWGEVDSANDLKIYEDALI